MGIVGSILGILFGGGRNAITETAEVFRVNAEASDARAVELQSSALEQLAAEFEIERKGWFDRFIDGLNRIPRPALALGTLGLFIAAMVDPVWFSQRMQGLALVPEPLWWLLGAIVSFYFGARHQVKSQQFQRSIAATMARTP
ncbi:MAG: holin family protein, partial [Pseudomonadota bacterium]